MENFIAMMFGFILGGVSVTLQVMAEEFRWSLQRKRRKEQEDDEKN